MVTTLFLVRHGEIEGGEVKRYKGSMDVPLSEKGIEQMKQAAKFIYDTEKRRRGESESYNLTVSPCHRVTVSGLMAVYCSPLSRALRSAEIIAEPHGLKPGVMPDLRERSFGIWEGMSFDEIREKYPEEFDAWAGNPLKFSPIEGESTLEVRDRVINVLDGILGNHREDRHSSAQEKGSRVQGFKDSSGKINDLPAPSNSGPLESFQSVAIVAHGGVNRVILCHLLGIPLENIFRIEQDYAAVNIIEFWDKYPVVKLINGGVIG